LPHIKRVKLLISVERQREREKERWEGKRSNPCQESSLKGDRHK